VVVPVGQDGKIDVFNGGATAKGADVIVDVTGYYSGGSTSAYMADTPTRIIDTRDGTGLYKGIPAPLANDEYLAVPLGLDQYNNNIPSITGVVLNATVTNTRGSGFLAVAPDPNTEQQYANGTESPVSPPNSSNLNWLRGNTVPNLVQASTGATGMVDFFNLGANGGNTDLIVDVFGYYQNE